MSSETGERDPAPRALRLVQEFINTKELDTGRDDLASPDLLREWLAGRGLVEPDEPVGADDLRAAIEFREALRGLLRASSGEPVDPEHVEVLNRTGRDAALRLRFDADGTSRLEPTAGGVRAGLGKLLAVAFGAMADGTWRRFKVCRDETCRWAFYDHSRNRSGTWCAMAVCGNREKARSWRRRHADRGAAGDDAG